MPTMHRILFYQLWDRIMKNLLLPVSLLITVAIRAQEINIIPKPAEITTSKGFLKLKQPIGFIYNDDVPGDFGVSFFKDYLKKYYKISQFKEGTEHSYGFPTEIFVDYDKDFTKKDGYELIIDTKLRIRKNK